MININITSSPLNYFNGGGVYRKSIDSDKNRHLFSKRCLNYEFTVYDA